MKPEKKDPRIMPKKIEAHLRRPISRTVHSFVRKISITSFLSFTNQEVCIQKIKFTTETQKIKI